MTAHRPAVTSALTWQPAEFADILEYDDGTAKWISNSNCPITSLTVSKGVQILFIPTKLEHNVQNIKDKLFVNYGVPAWFWTTKIQNASGYYHGADLSSTTGWCTTISHFLVKYVAGGSPDGIGPGQDGFYDWHKQSFVTIWKRGGTAILLCFNVAESQHGRLKEFVTAMSPKQLASHPFAYQSVILDHIVSLYDSSIWNFRDFVREQERQRPTVANPEPNYVAMHELARHVMHCSEVSETAIGVIDDVLADLARYQPTHQTGPDVTDPAIEIRRQRSLLKGMHLRSRALGERLRNEINLAFHIASQADSLIQAKIAAASQRDSNATRTISILGLVFLPGTFISALFSMSFFNYTQATDTTPASWSMASQFWIYWVVAIPVTAITICIWFYWQRNTTISDPKIPGAQAPSRDHIIQIHDQEPKSSYFTF